MAFVEFDSPRVATLGTSEVFFFASIWSEVRADVRAGMVLFLNFLAKVLGGEGLGGLRGCLFVEIDMIFIMGSG